MVKIRKDIFPKVKDDIFETRENFINRCINESYESLKEIFSSRNNFIEYINSLKSRKIAELFIRTSQFYLICKKYVNLRFIKLIMIISIIERLSSRMKKYLLFKDWIFKQDRQIEYYIKRINNIDVNNFKNIIQVLKDDYHLKYGSQQNVKDFFTKYTKDNDKLKLVKNLKPKRVNVVYSYSSYLYKNLAIGKVKTLKELEKYNIKRGKKYMPICYNWKLCYVNYGECCPDIYCKFKEDNEIKNKTLQKVIGLIYDMRSKFVHSAKIPPLSEDAPTIGVSRKKMIIVNLTTNELEKMFEFAFKRYFDELI